MTDGQGYSTNPCIAKEASHFTNLSLYVNTGWYNKSTHINPTPQKCVPQETITALPIIMGTMLASMRSTRQRALGFPVRPGGSTLKRATPGIRTSSRIRIAYKVSMTLWWPMARQPWVSIARQLNGKALRVVGKITGLPGALRPGQPRNKLRPIVLDTSLQAARVISCNTCPNAKVDYDVAC